MRPRVIGAIFLGQTSETLCVCSFTEASRLFMDVSSVALQSALIHEMSHGDTTLPSICLRYFKVKFPGLKERNRGEHH